MRSYEATSLIEAPPEQVWPVLTDIAAWPSWDSGVTNVDGRLALGEKLSITVAANPGRAFPVKVVTLSEPDRIVFRGGMPLGLFTGERTYTLEREGAATCFTMREQYTGPLAGMIFKSIPDLGPSFQQFADGLKRQAESRQPPPDPTKRMTKSSHTVTGIDEMDTAFRGGTHPVGVRFVLTGVGSRARAAPRSRSPVRPNLLPGRDGPPVVLRARVPRGAEADAGGTFLFRGRPRAPKPGMIAPLPARHSSRQRPQAWLPSKAVTPRIDVALLRLGDRSNARFGGRRRSSPPCWDVGAHASFPFAG